MHIVVDAADPGRYRVAFRHVLKPVRIRLALFGGLLAVIGVIALFLPGLALAGVVMVVVGLLFGALLPARLVAVSMRQLNTVAAGPTRFELTDQYVSMITPLTSSQIAWAAYNRIDEIPGQILLRMNRAVLSVPTTGLHPTQLAELREFIANRNFISGVRGGAVPPPAAPGSSAVPDGSAVPDRLAGPPGHPQPRSPWPAPEPGYESSAGHR